MKPEDYDGESLLGIPAGENDGLWSKERPPSAFTKEMFDEIAETCRRRLLRPPVWVLSPREYGDWVEMFGKPGKPKRK